MYDAIVIGAGITGASVARELARYDIRTAVLEKKSDVCAGTSRSNSAMVHAGHDAEPGTLKALYNVRGNAMYDDLCRDLDVPFSRSGTIVMATCERDMEIIAGLKERAGQNGVPGVAVYTREELLRLEPDFGEELVGGLYAPTGGIVCPYSLVIALCENAAENGVEFRLNEEVQSIRRSGDGWVVETGAATLRTRLVFNCAGTHADTIHNMVSANKIKIIPRKGEHLILDKRLGPLVRTTITQTPFPLPGGGHSKGMGIMPSVDGTVILGCNAVDIEDKDDTSCTADGIGAIVAYFEDNWKYFPISRHCPGFPREMVITAFSGLRAHPEGDDFIIGKVADAPGFYNAAGIESPGMTAGPAIGVDLAAMAKAEHHFPPKENFNPFRKRPKPFRDMSIAEKQAAIAGNPDYAKLVCRCEGVTLAEVKQALRAPIPATDLNAVKMRTRAGMGRCQGGFCSPEVLKAVSEELRVSPLSVTQCGGASKVLCRKTSEGN